MATTAAQAPEPVGAPGPRAPSLGANGPSVNVPQRPLGSTTPGHRPRPEDVPPVEEYVEPHLTPSGSYLSFCELADSVLAYVRENPGCVILSKDDPRNRQVGFETLDGTRIWRINLTRLKATVFGLQDARVEPDGVRRIPPPPDLGPRWATYRTYLGAAVGRALIAASWTSGREPTVDYVPPYDILARPDPQSD